MITVRLKRGAGIPTNIQLSNYELGWSVDQKKLYINDNGTVILAAGAIFLSLNGGVSSNQGSFSFYAPTSVTEGKVVKIKDTVVAGEDPFTYITIDSTPTNLSSNLITSGGVKASLDTKVDKDVNARLITLTEASKLSNIEATAQVNLIESIQLNGTTLPITNKVVNVNNVETLANKVTSWSTVTNNIKYPSEKLVKDTIDTKLTRTLTDSGSTSTIENFGTEFNVFNEISGGTGVKLHFASGQSYLAKYDTGDTIIYSDGNKLLNKAEIAAMITGDASRLITSRSGVAGNYVYEPFATYAALIAGPWFYQGVQFTVLDFTENDYVYVVDDENHSNKQTMYVWDGATWVYAVSFSEEPLVADNQTLETYSDGKYIRVKDSGIGEVKLASNSVTTSKIANGNVTLSKLLSSIGAGHARIVGYNNTGSPYIITINNQIASPTTLYAPTSSGTSGQYLKAVANSAPVWETFPTLTTVTLNGSVTKTPTFYAPTTIGDAGTILMSNGVNNSPYWVSIIDGGTWA